MKTSFSTTISPEELNADVEAGNNTTQIPPNTDLPDQTPESLSTARPSLIGFFKNVLRPDETLNEDEIELNGATCTKTLFYFDKLVDDNLSHDSSSAASDLNNPKKLQKRQRIKPSLTNKSAITVEFTPSEEKLYHSYMCLQNVRRSRLMFVFMSVLSASVFIFLSILNWYQYGLTPHDTIILGKEDVQRYILSPVPFGILARITPFPRRVDSNHTVLLYSLPFFAVAIAMIIQSHMDHLIFFPASFFHSFSPLSKLHRDRGLAFLFGVVLIVYIYNAKNNIYSDMCISSCLPPANIFIPDLTVSFVADVIENSNTTSPFFDLSALVNPDALDGSTDILYVTNTVFACMPLSKRFAWLVGVLFMIQKINSITTAAERKAFKAFTIMHSAKLEVMDRNIHLSGSVKDLAVSVEKLEDSLKKSKHDERELMLMHKAMEKMSEEKSDELRGVLVDSKLVETSVMIGKGGFGEVHLGTYDNQEVAVKRLLDISEESIDRFRFECFLMKNLRHPHIVRLVGVCWDDLMLACLLEYVPNGSLDSQLKKDHKLPRADRLTWKGSLLKLTEQLALGVQYLHDSRYFDEKNNEWRECIIHRDLKPDNMLITDDWSLKLTDFGEARAVDLNVNMTQVGTPIFIAPEILMNDRYDEKVDSYSFAICLIAMIRAEDNVVKFFFEGLRKSMKKKNLQNIGIMVLNNRMHNRGFRPELPPALYPSLAKLIRDCWSAKPEDRPSFSEIVRRLRGEISMEVMLQKEPVILKRAEIDAIIAEGGTVDEEILSPKSVTEKNISMEEENAELRRKNSMLEDEIAQLRTNRIKLSPGQEGGSAD